MVGESEVSNRLIVESKNDKFFIQALVNYLNINSVDIKKINVEDSSYLALSGSDSTLIRNGLQKIKDEAQKKNIAKIGIVLDIDYNKPSEWFEIINEEIANIFPSSSQSKIEKTSEFIIVTSEDISSLQIACYLTNVNGTGELETILREIKSQPSPKADCLEAWKVCVEETTNKSVSTKEFNKFWVNNYIRYDTCTNQEQNNASKYCSFEYMMSNKQHIWNFEHPALNELKDFLKLFD